MNLYVGNLSYSMEEAELENLFAEFGEIESVKIIKNRETGRSRGFGFVEMPDNESAQEAIAQLNEKVVQERKLIVNEARPRKSFNRRKRY